MKNAETDKWHKLQKEVGIISPPGCFYTGLENIAQRLPLNISVFTSGGQLHSHTEAYGRHVLTFCIKGFTEICIDGRMYKLDTGSCALILPFQEHLFLNASKDFSGLFITFAPLSRTYTKLGNRVMPVDGNIYSRMMEFLTHYKKGRNETYRLLLTLALLLVDLENSLAKTAPDMLEVVKDEPLFHKIVAYIHDNPGDSLKNGVLADRFEITERQLNSLFRKEALMSVHKYVKLCRINHARAMLAQSEESISEISHCCGYESIASFSIAFKELTQMTPGHYRRMCRKS